MLLHGDECLLHKEKTRDVNRAKVIKAVWNTNVALPKDTILGRDTQHTIRGFLAKNQHTTQQAP